MRYLQPTPDGQHPCPACFPANGNGKWPSTPVTTAVHKSQPSYDKCEGLYKISPLTRFMGSWVHENVNNKKIKYFHHLTRIKRTYLPSRSTPPHYYCGIRSLLNLCELNLTLPVQLMNHTPQTVSATLCSQSISHDCQIIVLLSF